MNIHSRYNCDVNNDYILQWFPLFSFYTRSSSYFRVYYQILRILLIFVSVIFRLTVFPDYLNPLLTFIVFGLYVLYNFLFPPYRTALLSSYLRLFYFGLVLTQIIGYLRAVQTQSIFFLDSYSTTIFFVFWTTIFALNILIFIRVHHS